MSDIMNKLEEIEKKIDELKAMQNPPVYYPKESTTDTSSNNSTFSPEDLKEEDIPTVEDEDTL